MNFEIVFLPVITGAVFGIFIGLFLKVYLRTLEIFDEKKIKSSCFFLSIKLFVELLRDIKEVLKQSSLKEYLLSKVEKNIKQESLKQKEINLELENIIKRFGEREKIKVFETGKNNSIFFLKEQMKETSNNISLPNVDNLKGVETKWQYKLSN